MNKSGKIFFLVLVLVLLILFFFPKPSGHGTSVIGMSASSCSCLGFEHKSRAVSAAQDYCFGLPYACVSEIIGGYPAAEAPVKPVINSFEECAAAGFPVMESYPRQCRTESGDVFTEDIYGPSAKQDLIRVFSPQPEARVSSPLVIEGEARGTWFFEATFPVILTNWDGLIIAEHYAQAQGDWMTEEFVPFSATLEFESPYQEGDPEFMRRGALILRKDNPSGLPEHDDALEYTIYFE